MRCLVALGTNLGDRHAVIRGALAALGRVRGTRLIGTSPVRETPPERPGDGGPYLNAVALLESALGPEALLEELLGIERRYGRRRQPGQRGPRTLDLDLILHGARRRRGARLVLPHPRFRERRFVLEPARDVAPGLRDPVSGRTLSELYRAARGGAAWSC